MNNDKISKLVDHQVFQQIQTTNSDHPFGQGTILFANYLTGTPVDMSQRVRDALTSESIFVGNNPIVQLQKALERLENGPWYIDCRGEVLYIHNKPYKIPSVYNYVYANENGEVLSISFKTQYRTRNATRGTTKSFDSFNKSMKTTSTGISVGSEQELAEQAKVLTEGPQLNGPDVEPNYLSPDISSEAPYYERYYRNRIPSLSQTQIQKQADLDYKEVALEDYKYMVENAPEVHTNHVQSYLNSKNMGRGTRGEAELREALKQTGGDKVKVQQVFKELFADDEIEIDNGMYRPIVETKSLKDLLPRGVTYIPAYSKNRKPLGTSYVVNNGITSDLYNGDFLFSVEEYLRQIGKSDKDRSFVIVSKPVTQYNKFTHSYENTYVQVAHKVKSKYRLSAVSLMNDYFSRYLNNPEKAYMRYLMNNAMNNRARKITEKRLEVEMRVIGRPSLTSSASIHIENIGSRSGTYGIIRVIHRLSSEGYTCSLTLSPSGYKVASETDTMEIGVGKSKVTKRVTQPDSNVQKEQPAKTSDIVVDISLMTTDEMEFIGLQENNPGAMAKAITEVAYNLYLRAGNKPGYQSRGVYHKHVNVSDGKISKLWFTTTNPKHGDDYEHFKTVYSRKFYDIIRKKSENYKRYHK